MPPLVLASASPRRRDLLAVAGVPCIVDPAAVEEPEVAGESPVEHVRRLAALKARTVAARHPRALVLGADTVVTVDGAILGKPADLEAAAETLRRLAGREHQVVTGLCLSRREPAFSRTEHVITRVRFRPLDAAVIAAYLADARVLDKAGAYAIQDEGATLAAGYRGSYTNIVGLPVEATLALLAAAP